MTLQEAKSLVPGQVIYCTMAKNYDGTPQRFRVTGQVRTWKRNPNRIEIGLKRGMYEHARLTEVNLHLFTLTAKE